MTLEAIGGGEDEEISNERDKKRRRRAVGGGVELDEEGGREPAWNLMLKLDL
ncbi:uncharacterized protein G2W53_035351 [Senna tora]|uniref:Uncharacterized protein n=1 Tax=Senna tora TaxID=362788 RepID=A0A834W4U9_9FABA|nr:uncharacterized protein G2W53_035351 [Senna tora]